MKNEYGGIYAALTVPYTISGDVDYKQLKRFVRYLINNKIDGFYVNGSTGEAFLLSETERKKILEVVLEENNGERKVICHVGDISTSRAIDYASHAENAGADAISAISPFYYKFSQSEIVDYYRDIISSTSLPMFIYNFPAFSGFSLTEDVLNMLISYGNLKGVKFTSSDFFLLERIKDCHPDLAVWNGYDEMLLAGLVMGADGAVGSTYNCLTPLVRKVYNAFTENRIKDAQGYQAILNTVIKVICKYGVYVSVKKILDFEGFEFNGSRKPFSPISEEGIMDLRMIYNKYIIPNKE